MAVIEWAPFWRWRRRKWRRGSTYGAVALRRRCYIIPHPTIYLVLEFEANRLKNDSYWMGAILRVAPPKIAPRRHVRRRSVAAALLHHSPSYDLPCIRIWSKSAEKWQSYWVGAIMRVAPPEMAPRRHVRQRGVAAALLHPSPSSYLPCTRIWRELAEKWQSYWMGAILRVAPPEMAPRRPVRRRSVAAALLHHSPS